MPFFKAETKKIFTMLFLIYLIFEFMFYKVRLYIVLSNIAIIVIENDCIRESPPLKVLNAILQFHSVVRIWVLMIITEEIINYNMKQRLNFSIIKDQTLRQIISGNYEKRNAQNQHFLSLLVKEAIKNFKRNLFRPLYDSSIEKSFQRLYMIGEE